MANLILNGIDADLGDNVLAITKQVYLLDNLADRNIGYSNMIELPNTNKNKRIFESPAIVYSDSTGFDNIYTAVYVSDHSVFSGFAYLIEANNTFKIQLIDVASNLFDNLDIKLSELVSVSDDFIFNKTSYDNLKGSNATCWVWPLVSQHINRTTNNSVLNATKPEQYSRPFVNFREMVQRAFYSVGWDYTNFEIPNLCLSANHTDFKFTSYQKNVTFGAVGSGTGKITLSPPDFAINASIDGFGYLEHESGAEFRLKGTITSSGTTIISMKIPDVFTKNFTYLPGTNEIDIYTEPAGEPGSVNLLTIDVVYTDDVQISGILYNLYSEKDKALNVNPWNGYKVKAFDNMPDVSALSLFKTWLQLYAYYFISDPLTQTLKLIAPNDFSLFRVVDWSDRFIQGSEVVSATFGSYGKHNTMGYTNDETVPAEAGSYVFHVLGANRQAENDALILPYSASLDFELDGHKCAYMACYNNTERIDNKMNIRLLEYYTPIGQTFTAAYFAPLEFNVLANNYDKIILALYRPRVVECDFALKAGDVSAFDFTKPIYIADLHSHFLVLKISEFQKNNKTKVTLLKL